jgi:hypothetical protein
MKKFFVRKHCDLNNAPISLEEALALASRHIYVSEKDRAQIRSQHKDGSRSQWTITYGFATPIDIIVR